MPIPASLTTRTVTGHIDKGDGSPETGKVTFRRSVVLESESDNLFLTPYTHTATLDSEGNFTIDLPVADDPQWTPPNWAYQIEIAVSAWQYRFDYTLTTGAPIDLSDILPAGPVPTPVSSYVSKASVGTVGGPAGPLDVNGKIPTSQLPAGSGGSGVDSVNGQTGVVLLDAIDVDAAPTVHGHAMSDVTGLSGALSGKADALHTHGVSDVTGLADALADRPTDTELADALATKANASHTHPISGVTGLQAALDGKQAAGSYAPASHTHAVADVTGLQDDLDGKADSGHTHAVAWGDVTGKPSTFTPSTHTHAISDTTGLQAALDGKQAAGSYAAASHTHTAANITDLGEAVTDAIGAALVAGTGITVTFNDAANTVTIAATGGGGTGDVVGPNGTIDNRLVRMDGGTGKLIQASPLTVTDAGDISGGRMMDRTVAADFGSDYFDRITLNYVPSTTDMDLERVYVQTELVKWLNENGFLRGTPHTGYKDDALVRGRARSDLTNQSGGYIELENSSSQKLHARRWRDGALIRGNGSGTVVCADVLVLNAADSVPAGTPVGTVILRRP